jgi:transcriptional regulator with XRE-family HTH domain
MERKSESPAPTQTIAQRLRAARERKNLSQSDLSERAGLSRKTCTAIESGSADRDVYVATIEKLAQVLDVSPAWLAFGQDDSEYRIAGLLQELVAIKKERLLNPARVIDVWSGDEEDEEEVDEDDTDACQDEDTSDATPRAPLQPAFPVWPNGHRPRGLRYPALPPLGLHYRPVLDAIGPSLPLHRRKELGQSLTLLLHNDERPSQRELASWIRALLHHLVSAADQAAVDLVIQDLESDDQLVRGRMALSLIIDGGLPIRMSDLRQARSTPMPRQLHGALISALEILDRHEEAEYADRTGASRYRLPPAVTG